MVLNLQNASSVIKTLVRKVLLLTCKRLGCVHHKSLPTEFKARTSSQVTVHMKIHTGVKPFHCTLCPFKSARQIDRTRHLRTHTGEKPFECEYCSLYRASQKAHLKKDIY